MLTAPANSPDWAQDFAKDIEAALNAARRAIPQLPLFYVSALPSAAQFWSTKAGLAYTGAISVVTTLGAITTCLSDGSSWIDQQTGLPVV